jgi:molybdopterin-guanine dinucleotide biosynthesis protein
VAIVVVGGHSRNIGKTSVVSSLIARLKDLNWTAFKITQYGHGFCTADGAPCDCQTDDHTIAISAERDPSTGTDSARFLAAGAARSLWVRTRQGMLAEAMPRIRKELAAAENAIFESNSLIQFLQPDLYLTVLDYGTADFKDSARLFLDRADAVLLRGSGVELAPRWSSVSLKLLEGKPQFVMGPSESLTEEIVAFVRGAVERANRGRGAGEDMWQPVIGSW